MNDQESKNKYVAKVLTLAVRRRGLFTFLVLLWSSWTTHCALAAQSGALFEPPPKVPISDEVLLVSTRQIGTACNVQTMQQGLICQRLQEQHTSQLAPTRLDWRYLTKAPIRPTIIYVHGNRVAPGRDLADGMAVYRSMKKHSKLVGPVRFVIFSWPASQIPGPIKDYVVKAQRTTPVAWQLAWLLDRLPNETPIALVGYSYGTRVVSGASHLLAGGNLGSLKLHERIHPSRPPLRTALLAAAYNADWVQPGKFYSHALEQTERLILATNRLDPAMRFYHLSNGRGRIHALGRAGVAQPKSLGALARRVGKVDFSNRVGRSHALLDYLAAESSMSIVWKELLQTRTSRTTNDARSAVAALR